MIERFCEKLIAELGTNGILIIGLYWLLYNPLKKIAGHLEIINKELGEIRDIIKRSQNESDM